MREIIISPEAERDVEGIWDFIAEDTIDAADKVRREIKAEIQKLAIHPGMGHIRQDVRNTRLRFWSIYSYLIAYRFDDHDLVVVRVIHGARDIGSMIR